MNRSRKQLKAQAEVVTLIGTAQSAIAQLESPISGYSCSQKRNAPVSLIFSRHQA